MKVQSHLGTYKLNKLLELAASTPNGSIIEAGVYQGGTLRELAERFPDRKCLGFDTFEGMPKETYNETEGHTPGEFAVLLEDVVNNLRDCLNVMLIKGLFPSSYADFVDDISFIHLDMDHGQSTKEALELLWPKLMVGGIILLDDYNWRQCANIKPVTDEFAKQHNLTVHILSETQAYLVKE